MNVIEFTIILEPKGQKRARGRAFLVGGQAIAGKPRKDNEQLLQEEKLITLMYTHRPQEPLRGPLMLGVRAYLPIPQSKSKKWKAAALAGEIRPTTKPDCSNMVKHLEDVMQGVFFKDDKEIVSLTIEKWYGQPARWEITIRPLDAKLW